MTAKKKIFAGLGLVVVGLLALGAVVFKPWLLFIDVEVNDAIPTATAPMVSEQAASEQAVRSAPVLADTAQPEAPVDAGPVLVGTGQFISHEHSTTGTASIFRLADGSHQLALENLDTSNGPDVHVWLSAGPVIEGRAGWFTAKDYAHVDLGAIKGNRGNQLYDLPPDINIGEWGSVVLWCDDFSVSFGAAALA